ncbi:chitin deacetylase [Magnaporthiopsis poae ATCC 64411]|uniref:Chitin deacetylase n=1 Tax=Magnaporthiopsis poae (strain ATCC 64411 / 73-15) TaxID=644358 RepID=A0A0C4EF73_MAGP6|nr:chitin deacetylase [Magnaporthiopsis poae ATCC 64411]
MSSIRLISVSLLAAVAMAHPHIIVETEGSLDPRALSARPRFGNLPYGMSLTSCSRPGLVALTFDDGPGPFTAHVLDLLEQAGNLKATFFLNGQNGNGGITVAALQPVVKRMVANGHQVGSHSFSHANFDEITEDQRVQELVKNEDAFEAVLGFIPTYFRPPFTACGAACQATATKLGYRITDYDLDTKDYEGDYVAAKSKFSTGVSQNPKSFVSLAHDIHERTSNELVPFMIEQAKAKGYQFVTMGDCLGDPMENWYRDPKSGQPFAGAKPAMPSQPSSAPTSNSSTPSTPAGGKPTSAGANPTTPSSPAGSKPTMPVGAKPIGSGNSTTPRAPAGARPTAPAGGVATRPTLSNGTTSRGFGGGGGAVSGVPTSVAFANGTRPATVSQTSTPNTPPIKSGAAHTMAIVQTIVGTVLAMALLI